LARALFAQALATEQDPGFRFDILMEWAIFERFHANPVEAIGLLEQALALRPDNTEARANYGAVLLDAGRLEEAIRELTAVITKSPDHFWANYLAGIAYYRSARLPEALASWQQAAKVAVNDAHQGMAIQRAVEAAMQIKDCATLRDIAQKYASALASQEKAVGQFLVSCP
jgi:tetratricopeptide (TPR) repeat protein